MEIARWGFRGEGGRGWPALHTLTPVRDREINKADAYALRHSQRNSVASAAEMGGKGGNLQDGRQGSLQGTGREGTTGHRQRGYNRAKRDKV